MCRRLLWITAFLFVSGLLLNSGFAQPAAIAPTTAPSTTPSAPRDFSGRIADQPSSRNNGRAGAGWMRKHDGYVAKARQGGIDLYFLGDSITDFWQRPNPVGGRDIWAKEFTGWNPGNFGISGDLTQHVLWRITNGELENVKPKVIVLMIGTNNMPESYGNTIEETISGVKAILGVLKEKQPQARILLLAIFPRNATADDPLRKKLNQTNELIAKFDDGKQIKFLNINDKFLDKDGNLSRDIFPDMLHPNAAGYQIWADAIKPTLTAWLGEPTKLPAIAPNP